MAAQDEEFPWRFDGRFWFRPALVRAPAQGSLPQGVTTLSLFGWSLGGVVALQYDDSPVGPYFEYVTMGALVTKRGAVGQWGRNLYVSTAPAEEVCQRVWGVPAIEADIGFSDEGGALRVLEPPAEDAASSRPRISLEGWGETRSASDALGGLVEGLPVLWTPELKALWAPLVPVPSSVHASLSPKDQALKLHRLRLAASSLRLHWCPQASSEALGVPLPVGLSADGLVIEISPELDEPL